MEIFWRELLKNVVCCSVHPHIIISVKASHDAQCARSNVDPRQKRDRLQSLPSDRRIVVHK